MNQTFDPSGQYIGTISFLVGLVNNFAPYLGVTVQSIVSIASAVVTLYGFFRAYQAHRKLAVAVGAVKA